MAPRSSSSATALLLFVMAGCASPITFRWPEQPIWPGQTRVLGSHGGTAELHIRCLGPGDITVIDPLAGSRLLTPDELFDVRLSGDAEVRLVNPLDGRPTAVSVDCDVFDTVQLRFEEVSGGAAIETRIDFDGSATVRPGEQLQLSVAGDTAVTSVSGSRGAPLQLEPSEPIDPSMRMEFGNKHVFRGPLQLRLPAQSSALSLSFSIRNAAAWSLAREAPDGQ